MLVNSDGLFDSAVGASILPELRGACSSLLMVTVAVRARPNRDWCCQCLVPVRPN
jgi:hypothetical protein